MWLLDHNLPIQLRTLLLELGVQSESAVFRKWDSLKNGDLVAAAHSAGFKAILTRDLKFAQAASSSLAKLRDISIVVIRLPQRSSKFYLEAFRKAWRNTAIVAVDGKVVFWP